jgi:hypothetical protein
MKPKSQKSTKVTYAWGRRTLVLLMNHARVEALITARMINSVTSRGIDPVIVENMYFSCNA